MARLGEGGGLLVATPLWIWWATSGGGYAPKLWIPGLVYLAVAAAVLTRFGARPRLSWRIGAPLAALIALAVVTAASVGWADDRGAAWSAAERTVLMATAFVLPALWPPSLRAMRAAIILFVVAALAGLAAGLAAAFDGGDAIVGGQLAAPTDYANATAALFGVGGLAALVLAAAPGERASARAAGLAVGGSLVAAMLLTQSRGGLAGVIIAAAMTLIIAPARIALALMLILAAGGTALASGSLLGVRTAALGGDADPALVEAMVALGVLFFGLALVGAVLGGPLRRAAGPPARVFTRKRRAVALAGFGTVGIIAVLLVSTGDAGTWARDQFEDFKTADYKRLDAGQNRLAGDLGSNRYDFWRVASEVAREHPATGVGGGNFMAAYLARRESQEEPVHAHGIWFESLAELGLPGALALLAFVIAFAIAWRRRDENVRHRAVRAAAVVPLLYLFIHGSVDWLWSFPVLTVPAFGLAAAALSGPAAPETAMTRAGRGAGRLRWGPAVLIALAALLATPLFLGARLTERAISTWHEEPDRALADLRTARRIDPLSPSPALVAGFIAVQSERSDQARKAFTEAAERNPGDWLARFELGLIAGAAGRKVEALDRLAQARERNPREPVVEDARNAVARGRPLDPAAATAALIRSRRLRR